MPTAVLKALMASWVGASMVPVTLRPGRPRSCLSQRWAVLISFVLSAIGSYLGVKLEEALPPFGAEQRIQG